MKQLGSENKTKGNELKIAIRKISDCETSEWKEKTKTEASLWVVQSVEILGLVN